MRIIIIKISKGINREKKKSGQMCCFQHREEMQNRLQRAKKMSGVIKKKRKKERERERKGCLGGSVG